MPLTKSRTHSPARRTSSTWAGSALTLGMAMNSRNSSSQVCSPRAQSKDCEPLAVSYTLQPPPEPLQPVSDRKLVPEKFSVVPPTEITFGDADGYCAGKPLSPDETKKLTPGCAKCESYDDSPLNSDPPQL